MIEKEQGDSAVATGNSWRTALLMMGVLILVLTVSAWAAVVLMEWIQTREGALAQAILDKGPSKVMRRIMILVAVPFVPYLLRTAGWRGRRDCGWSVSADRVVDRQWSRDVAVGAAAGFVTLGLVTIVQLACGTREWTLAADPSALIGKLAAIAVAAIAIGCLEETLVRGILFRVLDRLWTFWPAALVSSIFFAYGHYLEPDASVFGKDGVWVQTWHVLVSTLTHPGRTEAFLVNVTNLTLMGFVLCAVVHRTRTIWMGVGLHASWVALIKFNFYSADVNRDAAYSAWIGQRADGTDGILTSVVLVILAFLAMVSLPTRGAE